MFSLLSVIEELVYSCKQAQRPLSASKRKTREKSVCVRAGKAVIYGSVVCFSRVWFLEVGASEHQRNVKACTVNSLR